MGDIKKTSHDGYTFFIGVGPRLDFKLKSVVVTYVDFDEHFCYYVLKEHLVYLNRHLVLLNIFGGVSTCMTF